MMENIAISTAEMRLANRNRVFRALYRTPGGVTKRELAYELHMSVPTLNQNLRELDGMGLIDSGDRKLTTGGRRPRLLTAAPQARWAVGVELTARYLRLVAVDLLLEELHFRTVDLPFRQNGEYARALAETVEEFIGSTGLDREKLLGVGVAVPGIVEEDGARLAAAPTLGVQTMEAGDLVGRISYPVHLVNDANAGGSAESWGRQDGAPMAYLSLGRGVGGAVLFSGGAYLGLSGRSGEFGHMCIHPDGELCACGRRGCLEAYCSTARISDDLDMTLEDFFRSVEEDRGNSRRWRRYLDDLALGIGNIHMALDCAIVLGGKLSEYLTGERLEDLETRLGERDPGYREAPYLSICRYHDRANGVGAALYFIDRFLQSV